jgi:hypothetical protein
MRTVTRTTRLFVLATIFWCLVPGAGLLWGAGSEPGGESGAGAGAKTEQVGGNNQVYDDAARFIAGLSHREGSLAASEDRPTWAGYARSVNQGWERFAKQRLQPMREWASRELGAAAGPVVFYPFSGPDFINVFTLFPQAQTYLLVALEPVGELPDFAAGADKRFFADLQRSLHELLQFDFFITAKMETSLKNDELKGVLPVLLFFLAREKARVLDVRYWVMRPDGTIEESAAGSRKNSADGIPGVRLVFQGAGGAEKQTLYYFQANLRNDGLAKSQPFVAFLKSFGQVTTFSKAASYLMFKPHFSAIRQFILDQSQYVLQTDSVVPLRHFNPATWNLRFYGTYTSPISLFSKCRQPDLANIYKKGRDIQPLPFGIGYRHRLNTSNLMLASKKPVFAADTGD